MLPKRGTSRNLEARTTLTALPRADAPEPRASNGRYPALPATISRDSGASSRERERRRPPSGRVLSTAASRQRRTSRR
jgi:hypothetical protein